ncbi:MAG: response regulator transcription factor [Acidimicrobiaceae bacterium]|nr:response regulator transcription factor [Acidimicrobiaceae bacterium]
MRILIAEDDPAIASFLVKGLKAEGYATAVATSGTEANTLLSSSLENFDLVLLDLGLPGVSGVDVLSTLRQRDAALPVIVLTARAEVADKVRGLELGANDYVTKPFSFAELLARIRATLRSVSQPTTNELVVGDLRLDLFTKVAWRGERRIDLAPREWALLELFMRHPTHVLSRTRILNEVWEYGFDPGNNIVDVYVSYLRKKINFNDATPLILTVRGAGYRLVAH